MSKKPRSAPAADSPMRPLTPEEDALQLERGSAFRKLITDVIADMLPVTTDHAVFLSGGVDSTAVLISMLELGARPTCITYRIGKLSTDGNKARQLAEHFGLPFHVVDLPPEPDAIARNVVEMLERYPDINGFRRPDVEVIYIMREMFKYAASIGVHSVYAGFGDADIHLLGREQEVRGRTFGIPDVEVTTRQALGSDDAQIGPLAQIADDLGITFCLPITIATSFFPYTGLDWRIMNVPVKKEITKRAYRTEMEEAGVNAMPSPLQNGNSGAREYFDEGVAQSEYAQKFAGRAVDTNLKFINSVQAQLGRVKEVSNRKNNEWEAWRKNVIGREPQQKGYVPKYQITNNGIAVPPEEASRTTEDDLFGGDDLFGSVLEDMDAVKVEVRDADGNPDLRVDCFGVPFYTGAAHDKCDRAQAGLCGAHREEKPVTVADMHACEFFDSRSTYGPYALEQVAKGLSNTAATEVYLAWTAKARKNADEIVKNARETQVL